MKLYNGLQVEGEYLISAGGESNRTTVVVVWLGLAVVVMAEFHYSHILQLACWVELHF